MNRSGKSASWPGHRAAPQNFSHSLVQRWVDITDAAINESRGAQIKVSPAASSWMAFRNVACRLTGCTRETSAGRPVEAGGWLGGQVSATEVRANARPPKEHCTPEVARVRPRVRRSGVLKATEPHRSASHHDATVAMSRVDFQFPDYGTWVFAEKHATESQPPDEKAARPTIGICRMFSIIYRPTGWTIGLADVFSEALEGLACGKKSPSIATNVLTNDLTVSKGACGLRPAC